MMFADYTHGRPQAKDPAVVKFRGLYWLYYSIPAADPDTDLRQTDLLYPQQAGWTIGIAVSRDLHNWKKAGVIAPEQPCEAKGICAPGAIVLDGRVHLFYQTYGNFPHDAICHASSADGMTFERNPTNPIFAPVGEWNNGRAIDAEVIVNGSELMLYYATRDPAGEVQMLGVASASLESDFARGRWRQLTDYPIMRPELEWEGACTEAAAVCKRGDIFVMFYAGAYNNSPQQIGVAISQDGIAWSRLWEQPFLPNGQPGSWNSSESGHPFLFVDDDGRSYLFYQGNADQGHTWFLDMLEIGWEGHIPYRLDKA